MDSWNSFGHFVWVKLESIVLVMNVILDVDADLKNEIPAFGAKDQNKKYQSSQVLLNWAWCRGSNLLKLGRHQVALLWYYS